MKFVAVLLSFSLGCSAVFMERLPQTFDAATTEPRCTATRGFAVWDGAMAVVDAVFAGVMAYSANDADQVGMTRDAKQIRTFWILSGVGAGLAVGHFVSAYFGASWAERCDEERKVRQQFVELEKAKIADEKRADAKQVSPPVAAPPRGYFCVASFCARERSDCERVRNASGQPDACALQETAFCFGVDVCLPKLDVCEQRRVSANAETSCEERR